MKPMLIMAVLVAAALLTFSCSRTKYNRPREKGVQALQLLGSAGGGSINIACSKIEALLEAARAREIFSGVLKTKDFAINLHEAARKVADAAQACGGDSDEAKASFAVEKNPTIDQIRNLLGKEDSAEGSDFLEIDKDGRPIRTIPITLYKFGWLEFGVPNADNKVIGVVFEFKKFKS